VRKEVEQHYTNSIIKIKEWPISNFKIY